MTQRKGRPLSVTAGPATGRDDPDGAPRTLTGDLRRLLAVRPRALLFAFRRRVLASTTGRRMLLIALAAVLPVALLAFVLASTLGRTAGLIGDVGTVVEDRVAPVLVLSDELAESQVMLDRYFNSGAAHDRAALLAHAQRVESGFALLQDKMPAGSEVARLTESAYASWSFIHETLAGDDFALPATEEGRTALLATFSQTSAAVRRDLVRLTGTSSDAVVDLADEARATATGMRVLVYGGVPLALLLGSVLVVWLVRDVRRGTAELLAAAARMEQGDFSTRVPEITHGDLAPVARAFNQMADRLERQSRELEGIANRDELTGVMNRRGFETVFRRELERAGRYGHPTALLLLDIDHFKQVNDTHGHPAGDAVLQGVAQEITAAVRGVDRVGRWGGEEFAVLLPETDADAARMVAERIRRLVAQRVVDTAAGRIAVTVSIGMAVADPDDVPDASALLDTADEALYAAKDRGRNRVEAA
ncbi:MAG: diguanylate cyclase [Nitriliruptorales bacterium]|nr:diguanylate cyclase [Nitriliruptorales bacterium]